jgi:pimeloyl-ACP methyl ester carboxylesterase
MVVALIIIIFLLFIYLLFNPLDKSSNARDFYKRNLGIGPDAALWSSGGLYFRWQSNNPENNNLPKLNIFYRTFGNINNPAIVMVHGWPTSSYDFKELISYLEKEYFIAVIDTPGYGFSDKPKGSYRYSISDDARLLDYFIREILDLRKFTLLTHDKGDSVGFAFLALYQKTDTLIYKIDHHVILNGGIYLPLAKLSAVQKYLTIPIFGQFMTRFILTPDRFTKLLAKIYFPALTKKQQLNISSIFNYQGGTTVFPKTLKYIQDRRQFEQAWLKTLKQSKIPATLIWGERDPIAKTEIADFIWDNYLKNRDAPASYWRIPCASHYLQNDQPSILAQLINQSLSGKNIVFIKEKDLKCIPTLVDETWQKNLFFK